MSKNKSIIKSFIIDKLEIKPETKKDFPDITQVNDSAFGQKNEGLLVERLRNTVIYISGLSLVAVYNNKIIGHILFYPIDVPDNVFFALELLYGALKDVKGVVVYPQEFSEV